MVYKLGKTTTAHDKGASEDVAVYSGTIGNEVAINETVNAYNPHCDMEQDKWCVMFPKNGGWELFAGEC